MDTVLKLRFSPTPKEIDSCEMALITKHINGAHSFDSKGKELPYYTFDKTMLVKYKRQYFGFIKPNGDKVLVINAFNWNLYPEKLKAWLNVLVFLSDADTWVIEYDLKTGQFSGLYFDATIG